MRYVVRHHDERGNLTHVQLDDRRDAVDAAHALDGECFEVNEQNSWRVLVGWPSERYSDPPDGELR